MLSVTDRLPSRQDQLPICAGSMTRAAADFTWPRTSGAVQWAVDWFDVIARGNDRPP